MSARASNMGRCKYAGSYGYEWGMIHLWGANEDLPPILLLHVGERWYQPGTGRFVQRDPFGIEGAVNVYLYCGAAPGSAVDPEGLTLLPIVILPGQNDADLSTLVASGNSRICGTAWWDVSAKRGRLGGRRQPGTYSWANTCTRCAGNRVTLGLRVATRYSIIGGILAELAELIQWIQEALDPTPPPGPPWRV